MSKLVAVSLIGAELVTITGYAAGDVIGDHDHALCYLMEPALEFKKKEQLRAPPSSRFLETDFIQTTEDHYPDLLPSFKELDQAERASVQFTQCGA